MFGLNMCHEDKIMSQDMVESPKYITLQSRAAPLQVVQSSQVYIASLADSMKRSLTTLQLTTLSINHSVKIGNFVKVSEWPAGN